MAWLVEEAEQNTVYTIWEDLHWADPRRWKCSHLVLDQSPDRAAVRAADLSP